MVHVEAELHVMAVTSEPVSDWRLTVRGYEDRGRAGGRDWGGRGDAASTEDTLWVKCNTATHMYTDHHDFIARLIKYNLFCIVISSENVSG